MSAAAAPIDVRILCPGQNWMNVGSLLANGMGGYHGTLPHGSTIGTFTGTPPSHMGLDGPRRVAAGEYHFGVTTPGWALSMARDGIGLYAGEGPRPLATIASFAHVDALALAVRHETGIESLDDLRERQAPLKISMPTPDQGHPAGWAIERLFEMHGFSREDVEAWGGEILRDRPRSQNSPDSVPVDPSFDAVFDEAIMTLRWQRMTEWYDLRLLPLSEDVRDRCVDLGMARGTIPAGRLRGVEVDVPTIDFSGWVLYCAEDLSDELSYLAAAALEEQHKLISARFTGPTAAMTSPIDMRAVCADPPVPLHPGAEAYYREHGHLR